jgi:multimeric flavodoxin WrbA
MPASLLAIYGSPREGGSTSRLLDALLEGLDGSGLAVHGIHLGRLRIAPCTHCDGCRETGRCILRDDMDRVYDLLGSAAAVAVASPVCFNDVTAQLKALIDRCQAPWVAEHRLGRPIHPAFRPAAIVSAAAQETPEVFTCLTRTIRYFLRTVHFQPAAAVTLPGIDRPGDLTPAHLDEARRAGGELAAAVARGAEA